MQLNNELIKIQTKINLIRDITNNIYKVLLSKNTNRIYKINNLFSGIHVQLDNQLGGDEKNILTTNKWKISIDFFEDEAKINDLILKINEYNAYDLLSRNGIMLNIDKDKDINKIKDKINEMYQNYQLFKKNLISTYPIYKSDILEDDALKNKLKTALNIENNEYINKILIYIYERQLTDNKQEKLISNIRVTFEEINNTLDKFNKDDIIKFKEAINYLKTYIEKYNKVFDDLIKIIKNKLN
jgi:hypothetical protein